MEIRSPCNSSSQTFSTVPAFPSVRTTVLPINSDCALPYSFKIVDARSFTGGIVHPCSAEAAAQPRALFQCSAASNSRSRSICALRLAGSSGSGFSDARSLSPISRTMARLCMWSMSIPLRMTEPSVPAAPVPPRQPIGALLAILNRTGDRRFWLSARALVLRTAGRSPRPLAIRDMRRVTTGERRPQFF